MYKRILVPLEHSPYDETILTHVRKLARHCGASLVLIHVADGWAARNYERLKLQESEEMKQDREYLENLERELAREGFEVSSVLKMGDPAEQIIETARSAKVDLIAMSTHGHGFIGDVIYGSTADKVRHAVDMPVLLLKVKE